MRAIVGDFTTDIYLSADEVKEFCRPGEGANTCIWLFVGAEFECCYCNKPASLLRRWEDGLTVAKRDGCDKVRSMSFFGSKSRDITF